MSTGPSCPPAANCTRADEGRTIDGVLTFAAVGRAVPVEVRRSPRARHARILVRSASRLELVVPRHARERDFGGMLESHRAWIERALAREERRPRLGLDGGLWLHGAAVASPRGDVERWYREHARSAVTETATREAARLGVRFERIRIADQRTRWGSCSRAGTLSFSWRLVVAPRAVLDYVVVHELCHVRHHDHSQRFWDALERARPTGPTEAGWLRVHGRELGAYRWEA